MRLDVIAEMVQAKMEDRPCDFKCAVLRGIDFSYADLEGADFQFADLKCANFYHAKLAGANLSDALLGHADFCMADLDHTVLDPANILPPIPEAEILAAGLELDTFEGEDIVIGYRTMFSQHVGRDKYRGGLYYRAPVFSCCQKTSCHPGIYMDSRENIETEYPDVKLVRCWCFRSDLLHASSKWRAKLVHIMRQTPKMWWSNLFKERSVSW